MTPSMLRFAIMAALAFAPAAFAQSVLRIGGPDAAKPAPGEVERRAAERCAANRGVDCDSPQGRREWIQQERPITDAERSAAAGARRHREEEERRQRAAKPVK